MSEKKLTDFGKVLRCYRVAHDVSSTDMATQLGVSRSFLMNMEIGKEELTFSMYGRLEKLDMSRRERTELYDAFLPVFVERFIKKLELSPDKHVKAVHALLEVLKM